MTNFALIMDLLKISPKYLLKAGFDHTLISRWRSGKRRLMPGRHQVKTIAGMFLEADKQGSEPILEMLLNAWYPLTQDGAEADLQELLEMFLTEKNQTAAEYQQMREARLSRLRYLSGKTPAAPSGIKAVRQGLLDFLDLIDAQPAIEPIYFVFTEDVSKYPDDAEFNALFIKKLTNLFEKGHRLTVAARSDRAISDGWDAGKIRQRLSAHLRGYIRTQLYDDFRQQGSDKILGIAGERLAFRVTREAKRDFDDSSIWLYHDAESAAPVGGQIREYFSRARPVVRYVPFGDRAEWPEAVNVSKELPCYLFTRLPHFGVAPKEEFASRFALTGDERPHSLQALHPLTLDPAYFGENTTVRHIFCETDIEDALLKKRHQAHEMSAMMGRKVWMTTPHLARQLLSMQKLLKTHKNYEVCFINDAYFASFLPQICLWGNQAVMSWAAGHPAMVSGHAMTVAALQGFCGALWEEIPAALRSRALAARKLNHWMKKIKLYGYRID